MRRREPVYCGDPEMHLDRLRRLPRSPRTLYIGARGRLRDTRAQSRLRPRLRIDPRAPALILSPHWDDAVLNCWSLLASERELSVVNVFAGIPPAVDTSVWEAVIGARDVAERARGRMAEDALALGRAGREPLNLPLLDRQHRDGPSALGLEELDRALSERVRSASRVYAPAGIGGHVDHVLTRGYGRMLARAGMPVVLYAELPYCIFHGWPAWVDGRAPEPKRNVDAYWQSFLGAVSEMPPLRSAEVTRLQGPAAHAKLRALQCYETSLNYGVRQLLSDPAFHGYEVRWELVRAVAAQRRARAPEGAAGSGGTSEQAGAQ